MSDARRRAAGALLGLGLVVACATQEWSYDKPGVTPARFDHDLVTCRREATDPKAFGVTPDQRIDRTLFNRCMERRGYTVKPVE